MSPRLLHFLIPDGDRVSPNLVQVSGYSSRYKYDFLGLIEVDHRPPADKIEQVEPLFGESGFRASTKQLSFLEVSLLP